MSDLLNLNETSAGVWAISQANGQELWRYTTRPTTPANESPRPFAHPMYSIDGDVLTNARPNDHP